MSDISFKFYCGNCLMVADKKTGVVLSCGDFLCGNCVNRFSGKCELCGTVGVKIASLIDAPQEVNLMLSDPACQLENMFNILKFQVNHYQNIIKQATRALCKITEAMNEMKNRECQLQAEITRLKNCQSTDFESTKRSKLFWKSGVQATPIYASTDHQIDDDNQSEAFFQPVDNTNVQYDNKCIPRPYAPCTPTNNDRPDAPGRHSPQRASPVSSCLSARSDSRLLTPSNKFREQFSRSDVSKIGAQSSETIPRGSVVSSLGYKPGLGHSSVGSARRSEDQTRSTPIQSYSPMRQLQGTRTQSPLNSGGRLRSPYLPYIRTPGKIANISQREHEQSRSDSR